MKEKEDMRKLHKAKDSQQKTLEDIVKHDTSGITAHQVLDKLVEKLRISKFGVSYGRNDTPVLRAGFFYSTEHIPSSQDFQVLTLASIRKKGKLIAEERDIALWDLSRLYTNNSPIEFKNEAVMTLEDYAFWMRASLKDVEQTFCQEILSNLMECIKYDPMWRIFSIVYGWIDIDPWQFMVEFDLSKQ